MSVTVSTGPDLSNLSSNWKRLQQTLSVQGPESRKRRRLHTDQHIHKDRARRISRAEGSPSLDIDRSNHRGSKLLRKQDSTVDEQKTSSVQTNPGQLAKWAADNHISAKDMREAYGASQKLPGLADFVGKDAQMVNGGYVKSVKVGRYIAIDCEMVGVGPNPDRESALARVSLVNYNGEQVYDSFVLPMEPVTDYRTPISGITPSILKTARSLEHVQREVVPLLTDKILIGHALKNDLDALLLGHPKRDIRDTSKHAKYRALANGRTPSLKRLAKEYLHADIQGAEHSSVEDARATMFLYRMDKDAFDQDITARWGPDHRNRAARGLTASTAAKSVNGVKPTKTTKLVKAPSEAFEDNEDLHVDDDMSDEQTESSKNGLKGLQKKKKKKKKKSKNR